MKTLKLAAGIAMAACLVGWRLWVVVGNLDPQIYDAMVQDAPHLVLWVKTSLVVMVAGFLSVVGYAALNESEAEADRKKRWTDMRQHVEKELTASVTRSVKSKFREREESLEDWQVKLEIVDKELQERDQIISIHGQNVEARRHELEADRAEVIPLRCGYEDARSTLDSLIEVTKADQAEALKILDKALKWVTLAIYDPEKFVREAKADRINRGWIEKYEKRLNGMETRIAETTQEVEQLHEAITLTECQPRKEVML